MAKKRKDEKEIEIERTIETPEAVEPEPEEPEIEWTIETPEAVESEPETEIERTIETPEAVEPEPEEPYEFEQQAWADLGSFEREVELLARRDGVTKLLADTLLGQARLGIITGEIPRPSSGNKSGYSKDVAANHEDAAANHEDASETNAKELLKKYFDQYFSDETASNEPFTYEEYSGLSDEEEKDITDRLKKLANKTEKDVMGKYASMTGGIPSTAAVQQAARAGTDIVSQLQDVLDSKEQQKYNRYVTERNNAYNQYLNEQNLKKDQQSDAYNKLSALLSLYGYNSSGNKNTTIGTIGTTTIPDSLSTDVGSSNIFSQIATVSGLDPKTLSGYSSSRIEKIGQSIIDEDNPNEIESGEVFKLLGPEQVAKLVETRYPNEIPYLLAAIIDYLYDNAYINGNEREEWLRETGLNEFYANEKARNYS